MSGSPGSTRLTHAHALASRSTDLDVESSVRSVWPGVCTLAVRRAPGSACHGYLASTATPGRLARAAEPRLQLLRISGVGSRPQEQQTVSSVGHARLAKDGRLSPNRLLREVRPAGATARVGLDRAMVRGLRYVES